MAKTSKNKETVPKDFKEKVVASFKNFALTIPTTDAEVEIFEKIYGTTDFDMPEDLGDSESILEWGDKKYKSSNAISNHHSVAMAAHDGKSISTKTIDKMKELHDNAVKKTKKKK